MTYNQIQVWPEGSSQATTSISGGLLSPINVFVNNNGDIYSNNYNLDGRVDKWTLNAMNSTPVMYVAAVCFDLFIDINDNIYCSLSQLNQVIAKSLHDSIYAGETVAGSGCQGQASHQLYFPTGIFVDNNLDLYIADSANNRIQCFKSGQRNATTVAGGPLNVGISLQAPTGIILDAESYLFIVDSYNNRIVGQGPNGFRCIVGCSASGNAEQQLSHPWAMAFDSYGNIYVTDSNNNRIQKFILASNDSGKYFHFSFKELSELHSTLS